MTEKMFELNTQTRIQAGKWEWWFLPRRFGHILLCFEKLQGISSILQIFMGFEAQICKKMQNT